MNERVKETVIEDWNVFKIIKYKTWQSNVNLKLIGPCNPELSS